MDTTEAVQATKRTGRRQCCHTMETGKRCLRAASPGEKFCHCHLQFRSRGAERPVRVPLMEDAASIRFVISEVLVAMSFGTMPAANANAMLRGCRMALDLLAFERKMQDSNPETHTEETEETAGTQASEVAETPESAETEAAWEPEKHPTILASGQPALGDLKAEWDRGMLKIERAMQRNLSIAPGGMGREWLLARKRGLVAPHPFAASPVGILGERDWGKEEG